MRIDILVFPGFDELDALGPLEVLKNAAAAGAHMSVRLVATTAPGEIAAAHGLRVMVDYQLDPADRPDVLIVPGGGWVDRSPRGARAEAERGVIPRLICELYGHGVILAGVCTGGMLLASAGLLRGLPAITHHQAIDELAAAGARVVRARVVDAGRIVTAGGVTSGLDLALWLVERFAGPTVANAVETEMEYERRGTVWREPADPEDRI